MDEKLNRLPIGPDRIFGLIDMQKIVYKYGTKSIYDVFDYH